FRIERDDLLEFADGLVEGVAGGRGRGDGILGFAELAKIESAEKAMGIDIVWRGFEQTAGGSFSLANLPGAEVEVSQFIVELGRVGVGVERSLIFLDGMAHELGTAGGDRLL